jgi:hypothetical protein
LLTISGCLLGDPSLSVDVEVVVPDELRDDYSADAPGLVVVQVGGNDSDAEEIGGLCGRADEPHRLSGSFGRGTDCGETLTVTAWIEPAVDEEDESAACADPFEAFYGSYDGPPVGAPSAELVTDIYDCTRNVSLTLVAP